VCNYETEPLDELVVKLDLARAGLQGPVYAEDAVTLEPVDIAPDGTLKLDVLRQRYRLIKISGEPPRFRAAALGPNLLPIAPADLSATWQSAAVAAGAAGDLRAAGRSAPGPGSGQGFDDGETTWTSGPR